MLPLRRLAGASPGSPAAPLGGGGRGGGGRRRARPRGGARWRALAMAGREVVVVEAGSSFGTGTSTGIYYPPGSLKLSVGMSEMKASGFILLQSKELKNHSVGSPVFRQLIWLPKLLINSAGLSAVPLAKRFHGLDQAFVSPAYYARGCYFTLSQTKSPFSHLIYPLPEDGGIGVHVTLDLNGLVRFGPDVEWIDGGMDGMSCCYDPCV